ncbi:DUF1759 domain-containing protein, partial [Klebsiella pneumoniae]|uniref:DUF1759 domain-containing protein n=1 Tax=Klebsiella pneumoniae TaxID=573 RepID=UPI0040555EFC
MLKWTCFRDTFVSLIHDDSTLSSVQKFHYLLGALKGEAASLIKNFPVDDRSYEQAWTKVKNSYNNPRVLASLLVQRILDCNTSSCRSELQRYELFLTGIADSVEAFKALNLENPDELI